MAKPVPRKQRAAPTGSENGASPAGPESLDQVRDILFGGQIRMVDARLNGLEERLLEGQVALRSDLGRQIAELDDSMKKGFAAQAERLAAERTKRTEDLKAVATEIREALKNAERRHQKLEELTGIADAELRDQLLKQSGALTAELTRVGDRLSAEIDRSSKALQADKLDVAALAEGLTELAGRLTGGGRGKGAARG